MSAGKWILQRELYSENPWIAQLAYKARYLLGTVALSSAVLTGCAVPHPPSEVVANAQLTAATRITRDLMRLPKPKGKVVVAVYGMRDQTGQYKPAPDSSFSTSVTQGAASMLVKALKDSGWYTPVERENLQNLLTERKIVRALETPQDKANPSIGIPQLIPASVIIEGGIIAFESNVRTGGVGANYLGVGLSTQYRVDQVTISLRSIDIRGGQILQSVSTTKTIYSYEIRPSVFKFVNFKDLVQFEAGMTRNEPAQLCVREAIEAAVVYLTVQGLQDRVWALKDEKDWSNPVIQSYLKESSDYAHTPPANIIERNKGLSPAPVSPAAFAPEDKVELILNAANKAGEAAQIITASHEGE